MVVLKGATCTICIPLHLCTRYMYWFTVYKKYLTSVEKMTNSQLHLSNGTISEKVMKKELTA